LCIIWEVVNSVFYTIIVNVRIAIVALIVSISIDRLIRVGRKGIFSIENAVIVIIVVCVITSVICIGVNRFSIVERKCIF